ncbi:MULTISPECIES: hypothetical protein [unclassified Phaeobacter]|uniref:hypothetical protein n=1 Tax=unclassified Phaeobacter TaxID=2621772 RepID=UPI003A8655BC
MTQDNSKHPKKPFNEAAEKLVMEVVFVSDMDDTLDNDAEAPLRGNTDPKHDPKNVKNKGLTPSGTNSPFGRPRTQGQEMVKQAKSPSGQPANKERQEELLNGNHTVEDVFNGLRVRATLADEPFEAGIRGGRIEQLVVTEGERGHEVELAHFLGGDWKMPPEASPVRQAVMDAVVEYDPECMKTKTRSEGPDKEQEREFRKDNGDNKRHSR